MGDEAVRFRPRVRRRVAEACVLSAGWVYLIVGAVTEDVLVGLVVVVALLPTTALRWTVVVGLLRQPWAVEIDETGVRWRARRFVRWSELERVEVHLTRGWRRLLPHAYDQVLFVTPVQASFADRSRTRPSGYAVLLGQVRATPAEVVEAVRRLGDVPVHGWPEGR